MIDIDELARLEKAATPGPWKKRDTYPGDRAIQQACGDCLMVVDADYADLEMREEDATLICALRNALPEIIEILLGLADIENL